MVPLNYRSILRSYLERSSKDPRKSDYLRKRVKGRATSLKCYCEGVLHTFEDRSEKPSFLKGPPKSRNRRIRKKQLQRWRGKHKVILMAHMLMKTGRPSDFVCDSCGSVHGFYSAVARNVIQVAPLPIGAVPFYMTQDSAS